MIRRYLLVGFLAISLLPGPAFAVIRISDSDFHRYPPRTLFTPNGKLVVAYRTAKSRDESSTLQIVVLDGKTGNQAAKHSYAVPSAGRTKISDGFVCSPDGRTLYYVELTGNPVILEISASTLGVLSESNAKLFNSADAYPRVERATDRALFLSAASSLPGKAVHIVALNGRDVSKMAMDEQISAKQGWGQSYTLSFSGDSLWLGGGKYWLRIGIRSGHIESKIQGRDDIDQIVDLSTGLIGIRNAAVAGSLQFFDEDGRLAKTLEGPGCGFRAVRLSPDEKYGVAVCTRTGTSEWAFGKTLDREAFIIDLKTMAFAQSISLSKESLRTSIAKDDWRVWYPEPTIWDSGQRVLIGVPDFSGIIRLEDFPIPENESRTGP